MLICITECDFKCDFKFISTFKTSKNRPFGQMRFHGSPNGFCPKLKHQNTWKQACSQQISSSPLVSTLTTSHLLLALLPSQSSIRTLSLPGRESAPGQSWLSFSFVNPKMSGKGCSLSSSTQGRAPLICGKGIQLLGVCDFYWFSLLELVNVITRISGNIAARHSYSGISTYLIKPLIEFAQLVSDIKAISAVVDRSQLWSLSNHLSLTQV